MNTVFFVGKGDNYGGLENTGKAFVSMMSGGNIGKQLVHVADPQWKLISQYILKYMYGARNVRLPIELISFSIKKVHAQL